MTHNTSTAGAITVNTDLYPKGILARPIGRQLLLTERGMLALQRILDVAIYSGTGLSDADRAYAERLKEITVQWRNT